MIKGGNMKKKILIIIGVILLSFLIFLLFFFLNNKNEEDINYEREFINQGYSADETTLILDKVPKNEYNNFLSFGYDKSLIDILSSKDYKEDKFNNYIEYYLKNKKSNISDIITIVNSGYNLMNYPASSLLANLVKEKYYINDYVARYLDYGNSNNQDSKKIIGVVNSKADLGFYSNIYDSNLNDNNLILVNKSYHLKEDYTPSDLVTLS